MAGSTAGKEKLLLSSIGARKHHILADGAIEQKRILEHHAELGAKCVQVNVRKVHTVHQHPTLGRSVESANEADDCGFARARGANQGDDRSRLGHKADAVQNRLFEAGESLSELGADVHDLEDRRDHEGEKHVVAEVIADSPGAAQHAVSAEPHDQRRHQSEHRCRGRAQHAGHGERLHHVGEQPVDTGGKDIVLALFSVVALDDAHAAQ